MASTSTAEERRPLNPEMVYRPATPPSVSLRPEDDVPEGKPFLRFNINFIALLRLDQIIIIIPIFVIGTNTTSSPAGITFLVIVGLLLLWNILRLLFLLFKRKHKKNSGGDGDYGCAIDCGPLRLSWGDKRDDGRDGGDRKDRFSLTVALVDFLFATLSFIGIFIAGLTRSWWWSVGTSLAVLFGILAFIGLLTSICEHYPVPKGAKILIYQDKGDDEDTDYTYRIQLPRDSKRRVDALSIVA